LPIAGVEVNATVGAVLSTVTAALGPAPASALPAASADCAAATDMVKVPVPEQPETVTEGVVVPPLVTLTVLQVTPPAPVTVMSLPSMAGEGATS